MFLKIDLINRELCSAWKERSRPGRDAAAPPPRRELREAGSRTSSPAVHFRAMSCELALPLLQLAQATSRVARKPGVFIFKLALISTPGGKRR